MSLIEIFSHAFMLWALVVGALISLCAALVGVSLVLRRNSMIGDGLSHAAFGAIAVATVLGFSPVWFALPVAIIVAFGILRLSRGKRVNGDAAIAVLSSSSLAIGVMAISIAGGVNIDLNSYLFGSILAVGWGDVGLSTLLAAVVVGLYIFAHNRIFAVTFDEDFAKSIGVKTDFYDGIFAVICSVVVVLGMRLLGALLISSLVIFPTLIAMRFSKSFQKVVILSAMVSVVNFVVGLIASYWLATPTGATVVAVNLMAFLVYFRIRPIGCDA